MSQYPTAHGKEELREAIADYIARRHGVAVDPTTQVIPTSGSKEAIFSTPLAFVDRSAGDVVAFPSRDTRSTSAERCSRVPSCTGRAVR